MMSEVMLGYDNPKNYYALLIILVILFLIVKISCCEAQTDTIFFNEDSIRVEKGYFEILDQQNRILSSGWSFSDSDCITIKIPDKAKYIHINTHTIYCVSRKED